MEPLFFTTPEEFYDWLAAHHAETTELWVGYYKTSTGKPGITWPESVDQALCFGWIDGVRKSVDDSSYKIRFTPRQARSVWSAVNITRFRELLEEGVVHPAGVAAFERRSEDRSRIYSYEQTEPGRFAAEHEERFRANEAAWAWFEGQAWSYRKAAAHWVSSARKEETQLRRLAELIADSAEGRRVKPLAPPDKN
ncbi:YdeI/OmpD-associated family protein [Acrocarpospora catenulata]|uniref:YdeI/OmpD-associated family protein n=1 Tax=Acrocarpospora catenulata TaxID=2836182 RepID=UPI002023AD9F|nr:YdeI/OmpD-associated family protein [Acrocarpospora catenulata]